MQDTIPIKIVGGREIGRVYFELGTFPAVPRLLTTELDQNALEKYSAAAGVLGAYWRGRMRFGSVCSPLAGIFGPLPLVL